MKRLTVPQIKLRYIIAIIIACFIFVIMYLITMNNHRISVFIIGDSISAGAGASQPEHKWWKRLSKNLKDQYGMRIDVENDSLGGNDTYSAYCRLMRKPENSEYDVILICSGANDGSRLDLYYENLLRGISLKYPYATVFCILQSSENEHPEKIEVIRELADYYGAKTIDMIRAFEESGYSYADLSNDGVHPNDLGQDIYLSKISDAFSTCIHEGEFLTEPLRRIDTPLNTAVDDWGEYSFFSLKDMEKINELEYELMVPCTEAIIGVDYYAVKGAQTINAFSSGKTLFRKELKRDDVIGMEFNDLENMSCEIKESIIISFSSKEMKDSFKGINISAVR